MQSQWAHSYKSMSNSTFFAGEGGLFSWFGLVFGNGLVHLCGNTWCKYRSFQILYNQVKWPFGAKNYISFQLKGMFFTVLSQENKITIYKGRNSKCWPNKCRTAKNCILNGTPRCTKISFMTHITSTCMPAEKRTQKNRVLYRYFLINVFSRTNTSHGKRCAQKRCPIKLYNILNLYIISYFARTAVDEAIYLVIQNMVWFSISKSSYLQRFHSQDMVTLVLQEKSSHKKLMIMFFVGFLFFSLSVWESGITKATQKSPLNFHCFSQ